MVYRNRKHVVFSLGSLMVGTTAALLAASCAQDERGEPLGKVRASATIGPTATITAPPTFTINPCALCETGSDPCLVYCKNGSCGKFPKCDDGNPCTTDSCSSKGVCSYVNNRAECSDGDPCTTPDLCKEGKCVGSPIGCNDNNSCTTDGCKEGNCVFEPVAEGTSCDDQNGCTNSDACSVTGVCIGSGGPDCDDGNPCTKNACSNSTCNNSDYEPVGTPCLNENKCLVNTTCNASGECTSDEEKNCDDNNPCTKDSCDPDEGCVYEWDNEATCDDGDTCTTNDHCVDGVCVPESEIACEPIDDCHEAGECDQETGLCSDPRKADGEECETTGVCKSGRCEGGTPDPVGEGGAPATGEGGSPATAEGGAAGADAPAPSEGGDSGDVGGDAGGDTSAPARGGSSSPSTGGRTSGPSDGGSGDEEPKAPEFKRDPGGCTVGATSDSGVAGFLALAGLALVGLRRRARR